MTNIKTLAALLITAAALAACSGEKFHVNGEITNAKDSVLYFENLSLEGPVTIDSVKLSDDGKFQFQADAATAPEFYRLRIADQIINIAADSTETVTVTAKYPDMAWRYEISGSEDCKKIQELAYMQIALQNKCILIQQNPNLSMQQSNDSILAVIDAYKRNVCTNYIIPAPMKAYAYFALFQAVGSRLIFNPRENAEDIKMFGAVATSWDTYYPESERGENLHNIALEGIKTQRIVRANNTPMEIDPAKVHTTTVLDVALLDNKGNTRKLSDLNGKVILLDFHAFSQEGSTKRIMMLRELYNKYHAQGLEIYQVCEDGNEHFWKTQVAALPWISVFDETGSAARLYNVQQLPTFFLLKRDGSPYRRDVQIKDIDAEIKAIL